MFKMLVFLTKRKGIEAFSKIDEAKIPGRVANEKPTSSRSA